MENKLLNITKEENLTIDSREVAEMLEKEHKEIMRMIDGYDPPVGSTKRRIVGIMPTLTKGNFTLSDYFIEDNYVDGSGKTNKCYLCTKMGCEMLGNKLQGEKGILFSARYVKKFNQMETSIKNVKLISANKEILELKSTLEDFKRATEEAKHQYKPSHKRKLDYNRLIKSVVNTDEEAKVVKDWCFGLLGITKWEDTCIDDSKRILEVINTVARLLTIKKIEQITFLQ
jgi:phage regulator Rha-like protein